MRGRPSLLMLLVAGMVLAMAGGAASVRADHTIFHSLQGQRVSIGRGLSSPSPANFGNFEVLQGLIGGQSQDPAIGSYVNSSTPFTNLFNRLVQITIAITVLLGVGGIVTGGYFYMTAQGNASQVEKGKDFIKSSLLAIALAVGAVLLLNTISPQFGENIAEPKIGCDLIKVLEERIAVNQQILQDQNSSQAARDQAQEDIRTLQDQITKVRSTCE